MQEKQKRYQSYLSLLFWTNIILAPFILLFLLYIKGPDFGNIDSNIVFERYAIMFTLIGIPLALKLHHSQMQKIKGMETGIYANKYLRLSVFRMMVLNLVIAINMVGFYLFEAQNFVYMSIISIFALMFTYPNKNYWIVPSVLDEQENNNIKE